MPDHWFKAKFGSACKSHDQCYSHGCKTSRKTCDQRLLDDMALACRKA